MLIHRVHTVMAVVTVLILLLERRHFFSVIRAADATCTIPNGEATATILFGYSLGNCSLFDGKPYFMGASPVIPVNQEYITTLQAPGASTAMMMRQTDLYACNFTSGANCRLLVMMGNSELLLHCPSCNSDACSCVGLYIVVRLTEGPCSSVFSAVQFPNHIDCKRNSVSGDTSTLTFVVFSSFFLGGGGGGGDYSVHCL